MMRKPFTPPFDLQQYALQALPREVPHAAAKCHEGEPNRRGLPTAKYIKEICTQEGAHFPAVLALVRYELPTFSAPNELIGPLNRDDRPAAVLLDSYQTAWAVLAKGRPIRVRMRVPDGRFIRPDLLEKWARGEWEYRAMRAGDVVDRLVD
jgi:hypothetical protein